VLFERLFERLFVRLARFFVRRLLPPVGAGSALGAGAGALDAALDKEGILKLFACSPKFAALALNWFRKSII
jgi:hypothetical protein